MWLDSSYISSMPRTLLLIGQRSNNPLIMNARFLQLDFFSAYDMWTVPRLRTSWFKIVRLVECNDMPELKHPS